MEEAKEAKVVSMDGGSQIFVVAWRAAAKVLNQDTSGNYARYDINVSALRGRARRRDSERDKGRAMCFSLR